MGPAAAGGIVLGGEGGKRLRRRAQLSQCEPPPPCSFEVEVFGFKGQVERKGSRPRHDRRKGGRGREELGALVDVVVATASSFRLLCPFSLVLEEHSHAHLRCPVVLLVFIVV